MANSGKFIAYYRISTERGRSGLGVDAQRQSVRNFLNGGRCKIIVEFTEVEERPAADRPELDKALKAAA
jgi:DNA invertase Pin-like site-specific DNA recombinase